MLAYTMGIIRTVQHNELCWHNRDVMYTITHLSLECHFTWLPVPVCHHKCQRISGGNSMKVTFKIAD